MVIPYGQHIQNELSSYEKYNVETHQNNKKNMGAEINKQPIRDRGCKNRLFNLMMMMVARDVCNTLYYFDHYSSTFIFVPSTAPKNWQITT